VELFLGCSVEYCAVDVFYVRPAPLLWWLAAFVPCPALLHVQHRRWSLAARVLDVWFVLLPHLLHLRPCLVLLAWVDHVDVPVWSVVLFSSFDAAHPVVRHPFAASDHVCVAENWFDELLHRLDFCESVVARNRLVLEVHRDEVACPLRSLQLLFFLELKSDGGDGVLFR